ncbi:MAG TPA: hypothetical protein VGO42_02235 [Reyranella sp.]|nr:hypothetical protein [Reyranella sp.]
MDEALVPDPGLVLRHCTTSWVFSFNARSAGIEVTPAVVITRRDALAEALLLARRQQRG